MRSTKNPDLLIFADQIDLFVHMSAFGDFYTAGETDRAPRAPCSALICDFVLMQCSLENAHAGELRANLHSAGGELASLPTTLTKPQIHSD